MGAKESDRDKIFYLHGDLEAVGKLMASPIYPPHHLACAQPSLAFSHQQAPSINFLCTLLWQKDPN